MSTFSAKIGEFSYFCEILQNPPLFELIPQIPILKNLSPLLGQKSHKTGKFPPSGHTEHAISPFHGKNHVYILPLTDISIFILTMNWDYFRSVFLLFKKVEKRQAVSVARRGEFSHFVGFLAQKGGQIFEDGDLWD